MYKTESDKQQLILPEAGFIDRTYGIVANQADLMQRIKCYLNVTVHPLICQHFNTTKD